MRRYCNMVTGSVVVGDVCVCVVCGSGVVDAGVAVELFFGTFAGRGYLSDVRAVSLVCESNMLEQLRMLVTSVPWYVA